MKKITCITLLLLTFWLTAANLPGGGYVVVDDDPMFAAPGTTYTTIQAAVDSGATRIDVRPGLYKETVEIDAPNITLNFQNATIPNDGNSISIYIAPTAAHTTITGNVCLVGQSDGADTGDDFNGTGVYIEAPYVRIEGLCTRNLHSYSVLVPRATAHHTTITNCDLQNVATSPNRVLYTNYAILFINGSSDNLVSDCLITGHSQAVGFWFGVSRSVIQRVRAEHNWGCIIVAEGGCGTRSAVEIYGVPDAPANDNAVLDSFIDGSTSNGIELADTQNGTRVIGNTIRNVANGAFTTHGSGTNKARNVLIADNVIYGDGNDGTNWFSGSGTIRGNAFVEWNNPDICTIYIHAGSLGDVDITDNVFQGGGCAVRTAGESGALRIADNRFADTAANTLWFDGEASPEAVIEGNIFSGTAGNVISAGSTAMVVRNNAIEGVIKTGDHSVIDSNVFHIAPADFAAMFPQSGSVITNNRIYADVAFWNQWMESGILIERNYWEKADGSAAPSINCGTHNTCAGNWTAGQVPPP